MDPESFWRQTPRTFVAVLQGRQRRDEADHDGRAWLAWHIGALRRVKKFPKLRDLMTNRSRRPRKRKGPEELAAIAQRWAAATSQDQPE